MSEAWDDDELAIELVDDDDDDEDLLDLDDGDDWDDD